MSDFFRYIWRIQRIVAKVNTGDRKTYFLYSFLKHLDTLNLLRSQ